MIDLVLFALVVTKLVDAARNAFDENDRAPKWVWNVLAFALGIGIAHVWSLNALPADNNLQRQAGEWITGLALGAAASGWHELLDAFSGIAHRSNDSD